MFGAMVSALRLWWNGCAGHRLTPWKSPYLRWRLETYTGKPAATLRFSDFTGLIAAERRQVGSYLRWLAEMRSLTKDDAQQ